MPFSIQTATGFDNFFNRLRDFLTADAGLVAAGMQWTQIGGNMGVLTRDSFVYLQGPGLAANDEVLVGLDCSYSVAADYYNIRMRTLTSYNPGLTLTQQSNGSTSVYTHLWDSSMPCWFIADGRRFYFVAQVSTVFELGGAGLFLPYCTPNFYPYAAFCGGTSWQAAWRWSEPHGAHSFFPDPGTTTSNIAASGLSVFAPDGVWRNYANYQTSGTTKTPLALRSVYPYAGGIGSQSTLKTYLDIRQENFASQYPLEEVELVSADPVVGRMGVFDGLYNIPGIRNSSGSIISQGGNDYLVFQNVALTGNSNYAALRLA